MTDTERLDAIREAYADGLRPHAGEAEFLLARVEKLEAVLRVLDDAVRIEGPDPEYHREQMRHLAATWPTLWAAIDRARGECEGPSTT